jgi:hypothetical protein
MHEALEPTPDPGWVLSHEGSVAIRISGRTVQATLVAGEAMEMRIATVTRKLTAGATLEGTAP